MSKDYTKLIQERRERQAKAFCWGQCKSVQLDNDTANKLQKGGY